jgi:PAS domain S-box-containing protein
MRQAFLQAGREGLVTNGAFQQFMSSPAGVGETFLGAALEQIGAAAFICDGNRPGCPIIRVSPGFGVIFQYSVSELVGRNVDLLLAPDNDSGPVEALLRACKDGVSYRGELICKRKDGSQVWCELSLEPRAPVGLARPMVGVLQDITERKKREEDFQDATGRYRGMFENAVEGIYQSTPEGNYLAVNPALARMYGYNNVSELLNQVSDIGTQIYVDPGQRERFRTEIELSGQVRGLEYQVRRADGGVIWISESARVVRDGQGKARYYEGFIEDITPRKDAEAARARLEKQMVQGQKLEAIGTLAGGIAHDFNNILCAMLGLTELALADSQVNGMARRNLEAVLKSADRAKDLIKQILSFSRRVESERRPVRLSTILKECIKLLNATLPSAIQIVSDVNCEEDTVLADSTELHQVIMNLSMNAAHAMRSKGGRLEYQLQPIDVTPEQIARLEPLRPGPHLCLTVRDSGCGMSREIMESIFDPFFTTKPEGEGTGLGLTLVQRIITRSCGHISVESQEGIGTTMRVYLPRGKRATAAPAATRMMPLRGRHERVLVVDDEIMILQMMQQHLRNLGYRVYTRADSTVALEFFKKEAQKIDLVITDHTMPFMQGAELAQHVGDIRPEVPVILMTGLNQPPDFAGTRHSVRRSVVKKPIDFVELSHRLREFLDRAPGEGPGSPGGESRS